MTHWRRGLGLAFAMALLMTPASRGYIEAPMSFGAVISQSSNIVLMRVESVDREKNLIIYRKVKDLKGVHPQDVIKHNIGRGGLRPNEWKPQMDWAEPGKIAAFFYNGGASETCIGTWWYQAYGGGEWWNHSHAEPFLLRSYCGPPEKLAGIVPQVLEGKEVIVPCMVDGNKEDLHQRKAKIQRLKVSLKLLDYNPKRDFVGWGGEDFRRVAGMPGFSHISALTRVDPEAQAISAIDFDGDNKLDLCLIGGSRVVLLQNNGDSLSESYLTGVSGARAAVWADYNGDAKPDLLLATPGGPRLFTNLGSNFRDDSTLLPQQTVPGITAAAWIDYDADGRPDVLLANGYHGLRLYRHTGGTGDKTFADVSAASGLGPDGAGAGAKADCLTVSDVDRDGRSDFLYGNLLVLNRKEGAQAKFVEVKDSGLNFATGRVSPVFIDANGDGHLDLFVPQRDKCMLLQNDGKGRFTDVTAKAGDLAKFTGWATSAAAGDIDNDGHLDIVIGCLKSSNRLFRGNGNGTFSDATASVGLEQRIFNTQAVSLVDLNSDGYLDAIFNNEGQDSVVLLGSNTLAGKAVPLSLTVAGKEGVIGSRVQILSKDGKLLQTADITGGLGRGGQQPPVARFALAPGTYRVEVHTSHGQVRSRDVTLIDSPVRTVIEGP